jgi:hypothetical protein
MSFLRENVNSYFAGKQPFDVACATVLASLGAYFGAKAVRAVHRVRGGLLPLLPLLLLT